MFGKRKPEAAKEPRKKKKREIMVARNFTVHHNDSTFVVEYDTDDGLEVLQFQLFSLTSIPPEEQRILGGEDGRVMSDDSDLVSANSDKLRLLSVDEEEVKLKEDKVSCSQPVDFSQSDEELARMLQAEEEALLFQQYAVPADNGEMEKKLRSYIGQVRMYEDINRQEAARKSVPVDDLQEKAVIALAKEGIFKPSKVEEDHAFLIQLLYWFKQSFSWVNVPQCDVCGNETISQGMGVPLPAESAYGASRVELYCCKYCLRITRFPRYNDPLKLLETRRGRCGEWANCFTLYCRAFGYDARWTPDFTDHVWTECFSPLLRRWMHLDPCEGVYDKPLLYEKGWKKNLNYVIAISRDGVYDVTKRYTRKWYEVLSRRTMITESRLSSLIADMTRQCRKGLMHQVLSRLEDRDKIETEELERNYLSTEDSSISLPGRQSGSTEWRISRSEFGSDSNCSISSPCPNRECVDEHVTRINDALGSVLSQFADSLLPISEAVELLEVFKRILVDIRKSPFRARRISISSESKSARLFVNSLRTSFDKLLGVLSLRSEFLTNGNNEISLAGDPVNTSIALPVVVDAINDTIHELKVCDSLSRESLSLPLLKCNRLHSGSVLASGEEFPLGIATSAFDGWHATKWEEPNGARGWIIYKAKENQLHELVGYDLVSANDAPERDPMDWILEGSEDEGSTWRILDEQTSQTFEKRFHRKTFKMASSGVQSNTFRFRFLAVKDGKENSRLQIAGIDLYARRISGD